MRTTEIYISAIMCLVMLFAGLFVGYRATLENMHITVDRACATAVVTVWGQADVYTLDP